MKLSLINVFRNASFKKLDWLPDLLFGIGFFVTILAMFWFRLNLNWFVALMLPISVGLITEGLFMVIHGIYVYLKNKKKKNSHQQSDDDYNLSYSDWEHIYKKLNDYKKF